MQEAVVTCVLLALFAYLTVSYVYGIVGLTRAFKFPSTAKYCCFDAEVRAL